MSEQRFTPSGMCLCPMVPCPFQLSTPATHKAAEFTHLYNRRIAELAAVKAQRTQEAKS